MTKKLVASSYEKAEEWCKNVVKNGDALLFFANKFDTEMMKASHDLEFPLESLNSLLRNKHLLYVKKRSFVIRNQMHLHVLVEYVAGTSILNLAKKYHFPPSLLARGVIENITIYEKKEITKAMRDPLVKLKTVEVILDNYRNSESAMGTNTNIHEPPSLIDPFSGRPIPESASITRLAREVLEATNSDPLYGPRFDKERNYIGIEYEMILERALQSMSKSKSDLPKHYQMQARGLIYS